MPHRGLAPSGYSGLGGWRRLSLPMVRSGFQIYGPDGCLAGDAMHRTPPKCADPDSSLPLARSYRARIRGTELRLGVPGVPRIAPRKGSSETDDVNIIGEKKHTPEPTRTNTPEPRDPTGRRETPLAFQNAGRWVRGNRRALPGQGLNPRGHFPLGRQSGRSPLRQFLSAPRGIPSKRVSEHSHLDSQSSSGKCDI